ncbi:ParA family protein [Tichowtungia aerotolerans]|uniref:AAA family ATPase n=1 Tax=Tichowtungia aerotolerans TaxID=2697043 RepID=A0A6P1M4N2_9BACT|nr:ParA family protein [Tichowtungia aerotolerans]QHI69550.1 AAA family ATPase [Tichowtungia aerotolerans]
MSTKVIALANQKGGVGKTTTAVSLSACLAKRKQNVLLIDLDPQANATSGVGIDKEEGASIYSALLGEADVRTLIKPTETKRLHLIPSELDLAGCEVAIARMDNYLHCLKNALQPIVDQNEYDYILFDCPPSIGILFMNALYAADSIIIPMQAEYLALEGLSVILSLIDQVRDAGNPKLRIEGIVMTMCDLRTNLAQQVVDEVQNHFGDVIYETLIPRSVRLSEAPSYGQPIIQYAPISKGSMAYMKLAKEFLKRQQSAPSA